MTVRPILVVGNPVLRERARRVSLFDRAFQQLVDDMIETMFEAPGAGLAGPQVGVPLRMAVIEVDDQVVVIVNPEIVKRVGRYEPDEGCLSVPGYQAHLARAERVTVKAKDRNGRDFRINNAEGLFAQALQHEIDHLDGHLYIDRVRAEEALVRKSAPGVVRKGRGDDEPSFEIQPVPLRGTWLPSEEQTFDHFALPLRPGDLWVYRNPAQSVPIDPGQGCGQDQTHGGEPCTFALEVRKGIMDGRCLTAARVRAAANASPASTTP